MAKRLLITGSAGFIGFHTARAAKARGDFVIGCDHFNAYYDPLLKQRRAALLKEDGITTLCLDICESQAIEALLIEHQITDCIHLAGQAGVRYALNHATDYVHSNLQGFVSLLEVLKKHPSISLVYASSSSVYGRNLKIPFAEEDPTDSPTSFYGATKKCNEVMAHAYHHLFGIPCTGLRFFTVYGPYGRPDMAYFSFTDALLERRPISVYGNGKPKRDFTYIDDIVQGILSAVDLRASYELFNLGSCHPHSITELIEILEDLTGEKALCDFQPLPEEDVPITYADTTKSARLLNFHPTISLREGLSLFFDWYLRERKNTLITRQS